MSNNSDKSGWVRFFDSDHAIYVNARHKACLERAAASLRAGTAQLDAGTAPEFVAVDLHEALHALGEVAGRTNTEDLLGVIFSRFCIGK